MLKTGTVTRGKRNIKSILHCRIKGIAVLIGGEDLEPGVHADLIKSLEENSPSFLKHEEPQTPDLEFARTPDSPG